METNIKSTAFSIGMKPVEACKNSEGETLTMSAQEAGGDKRSLNTGLWLRRASEAYLISPDINDYVIVPVPAIVTSVPNTNGDSASLQELTRFMPEYGEMSYKTWVGKPLHVEHDHKDIRKAKGIILDSYMMPIKRMPGYAKLVLLQAYDRTKDAALVDNILKRRIDTYSMGMWYSSYVCSICNAAVGKNVGAPCAHTRPGRLTYQLPDGRLAYRQCQSIVGFENSCVVDPAYVAAQSGIVTDLSQLR